MARSDGPEREIWGTWEELLLACAVNRHGTQSWDAVAMEVQSRSPSSNLLTPQGCRQRYYDLQRRFTAGDVEIEGGDVAHDGIQSNKIPWLDELRKIRVAELRREVQRSDVSIVSLQLKVKKLKEERREKEAGEGKPDLEETKDEQGDVKSSGSPSENVAADRISGRDAAGRSSNESNWGHPKDRQEPGSEDRKLEEPNGTDAGKPDPVAGSQEKIAEEVSYNGSSDTIAKAATPAEEAAAATEAPTRQPDGGVSGESVAESKGEAVKESSDVQSSVSLSKRRRRGRRKVAASVVSSGGVDEPEADEVSPVSKGNVVISQPLLAVLEIIRSHKYGSIFERRLESQETDAYRSLIRRHMDLEMIRSKLEEGAYSSVEFFRDLLLLCNNAIVFFPKGSSESTAAVQLRELISKEISANLQKSDTSTQAEGRPTPQHQPPVPPEPKAKSDPDIAKSPEKPAPAASAPLIACKKRSSISAKAAATAVAEEEREEKPDPDKKEAEVVERKRTKERSSRGLRTSKTRANGSSAGSFKPSDPNPSPNPTHATSREKKNGADPGKADRKNSSSSNTRATSPMSVPKKGSAANFLNRMKRSSTSNNGTLLESLKNSGTGGAPVAGGSRGGGGDQKKAGKGDARKENQGSRQGVAGGGKKAQGQNVPVKRSVGRPPKRHAPPPPSSPLAKRAREAEASVSPLPRTGTRKRGRR